MVCDGTRNRRGLREKRVCHGSFVLCGELGHAAALGTGVEGRSVFDLSLSGPPLAASEGLGPLNKKQKQSDLNAILWPKLLETCGFPSVFHGLWSPNQQCNQPITPSTDSTDPARPLPSTTRSGDRSTAFPPLDPPLALGLAAL